MKMDEVNNSKTNLDLRIAYFDISKQLGAENESIDETWDVYDKLKSAYSLEVMSYFCVLKKTTTTNFETFREIKFIG
jgi:hypothetical protein